MTATVSKPKAKKVPEREDAPSAEVKRTVVDIDAMKYAEKKLNEEHFELLKKVGTLQTEVADLEKASESLKSAVEEGREEIKKVNAEKLAASKQKQASLADLDKKIAEQSNRLKADLSDAEKAMDTARKEEMKSMEMIKDIEKSIKDLEVSRNKAKASEKKLKDELKVCSSRSAELKTAEAAIAKRETAVLAAESNAANEAAKLEKRERSLKDKEDAVRIMTKEADEKLASVNNQLKALSGYKDKVMKEHDRAHQFYTLINEARRDITATSYTEEDKVYVHLSEEQAKKVDKVAGDYLELLESVYKKKDS